MKKILVVLTILVLVAGFAFADISGKVVAEYDAVFYKVKTDSDAVANYVKPDTSKVSASFTFDSQKGGFTGENKPYVELSIEASLEYVYNDAKAYGNEANRKNPGTQAATFKVATFKIVGEDWSVDLLSSEGAKLDLAKSAIDTHVFYEDKADENKQAFSFANGVNHANGVSVSYKDYVVGLAFNTAALKNAYAEITVEAKTPEYTFGDVSVQAGAGWSQKADSSRAWGASAKVAYAADKVAASVAIDAGSYVNELGFDIAANVAVAPVTVDVYFANFASMTNSKNKAQKYAVKDLLSVKAVVDLAKINENIPVDVTITGTDLLNRKDNVLNYELPLLLTGFGKIVTVDAHTTVVKDFDITATAGDVFNKDFTYAKAKVVYSGIENVELKGEAKYTFAKKLLDFDVSAKYTAEKYTVKAGAGLFTDFEDSLFDVYASIESDKLVEGATLKASWDDISFGFDVNDSSKASTLGALSLSCTVEF